MQCPINFKMIVVSYNCFVEWIIYNYNAIVMFSMYYIFGTWKLISEIELLIKCLNIDLHI